MYYAYYPLHIPLSIMYTRGCAGEKLNGTYCSVHFEGYFSFGPNSECISLLYRSLKKELMKGEST